LAAPTWLWVGLCKTRDSREFSKEAAVRVSNVNDAKERNKMKWTQEMRRNLYARLVKDFGPYNVWGAKIEPKDKKDEFAKVLAELAIQFSKEAGHFILASVVQAQINWATTSQMEMKDPSRISNFILNKAAALDAGFISASELPTRMTCEFGKPLSEKFDESIEE
jgi:hypothetical protein